MYIISIKKCYAFISRRQCCSGLFIYLLFIHLITIHRPPLYWVSNRFSETDFSIPRQIKNIMIFLKTFFLHFLKVSQNWPFNCEAAVFYGFVVQLQYSHCLLHMAPPSNLKMKSQVKFFNQEICQSNVHIYFLSHADGPLLTLGRSLGF